MQSPNLRQGRKQLGLAAARPVRGLLSAGFAFLLADCAIHPIVDDYTRVTTFDVVKQIRCEAKRAIVDHGQGFTAAIAYEFTFDIVETNDASGSLSWAYPFASGNFGLVANAGLNRSRGAKRNFKLVDSFGDLRSADCSRETLEKNWVYPIAGDIGVYEIVSTFIRLAKVENPRGSEVFSFADNLKFLTTLSGGLKPKLTLSPVTDKFRLTEASAELGAGRIDAHEVVLALKAGQQDIAIAGGQRSSRNRSLVAGRAPIGAFSAFRGGFTAFGVAAPHSSILSTTLLQDASDIKGAALLELDRQRILDLQARTTNLLVGP